MLYLEVTPQNESVIESCDMMTSLTCLRQLVQAARCGQFGVLVRCLSILPKTAGDLQCKDVHQSCGVLMVVEKADLVHPCKQQ